MKKLLAVSVICVTAFLALNGCNETPVTDGSNLQGSAIEIQKNNAYESEIQNCPKIKKINYCKNPENVKAGEEVTARCQFIYDNCPNLIYVD